MTLGLTLCGFAAGNLETYVVLPGDRKGRPYGE